MHDPTVTMIRWLIGIGVFLYFLVILVIAWMYIRNR